jgi:type IV fimbrial biogenesis protein FimT
MSRLPAHVAAHRAADCDARGAARCAARRAAQRGVSLIEVAVVMTIFAVLVSQAVPSFAAWIRNTQIRTATEAVQNGLQLARAEAIRRNRSVQFTLDDVPGSSWTVGCAAPVDEGTPNFEDDGDCLGVIQQRAGAGEGTDGAQFAVTPAAARTVTFDSIGRVIVNLGGAPTITRIDATDPAMAADAVRPLRITVGAGGDVRMCDPALPASDPRRCL